jgi:hypothetical protein
MSKLLFQQLCNDINAAVGVNEFKSEEYIKQRINGACTFSDPTTNLFIAHQESTGGFVAGEINLQLHYVF